MSQLYKFDPHKIFELITTVKKRENVSFNKRAQIRLVCDIKINVENFPAFHCFGDIQPKAFGEAEGALYQSPATPTHFDSVQHFPNKQGSKDTFSSGISRLQGIVSRETENNKILPVTKFGIVLYILVFNMFCSIC